MKAIGMHIFSGSQTIGHLLEGWSIDTILEISDEMLSQNAYHFMKNYPNISVKKPSEYEDNKKYLKQLKDENYDLLFANPPCSGLSQINRNASVNCKVNQHIYRVLNMVNTIQPKTFLIENAPTLTTTGFPILKDMITILPNYKFIIINDLAGNHNVPMHRRRTLVVGFNSKYFKKLPKIDNNAQPYYSIGDALANVDLTNNKEFPKDSKTDLFKYYNKVNSNESFLTAMANSNISTLPEQTEKEVEKIRYKMEHNERIWDKSPWRPSLDSHAPSLASVVRIMHPTENRDLYVREYAKLMGYPDDYVFYTDECKTPIIQCIAQGVPVNFIRYISKEIKNSFKSTEFIDGDVIYINQCNPNNIRSKEYSYKEFLNTDTII